MKLLSLLFTIFIAKANSLYKVPSNPDCNGNETSAREYVNSLNEPGRNNLTKLKLSHWKYLTNMTYENDEAYARLESARENYANEIASRLQAFCWEKFKDQDLVRLATSYFFDGNVIPYEFERERGELSYNLESYGKSATVCKYENRQDSVCQNEVKLDPDICKVMESSRDHNKLLYYWKEWRNKVGNHQRSNYIKLINVEQKAVKSLGFKDLKERLLQQYEEDDFPSIVRDAYSKQFTHQGESLSLEKLYKEIHTFVKGRLITIYKEQGADIENNGPIPAHLVGDMWAETWRYLDRLVQPFPNTKAIDISKALVATKTTPSDLLNMSERFLLSLGFEKMTQKFWDNSIFVEPRDSRVDCHASTTDMFDNDDYRILMCTQVTPDYYVQVHQKMGKIAYFMQYRNNTFMYRKEAAPGFHDAVEDLIELAVTSPSHLKQLNLLGPEDDSPNDFVVVENGTSYRKRDINYLMKVALTKVVYLPYALTMDSWKWKFFSGNISEANLNEEYWKLREDLQGIKAPDTRTEDNLDPAANLDVIDSYSLIERFFSDIIQYQFYEALCKSSGQYNPNDVNGEPLHYCDYSLGGKETGRLIRNMMEKGRREHWTNAMVEITGTTELSGDGMVKYFLPLYKYLKKENAKSNIEPWK